MSCPEALGPLPILNHREDDLGRSVIVSLEQVAIAGVQRERAGNHLLDGGQRLSILRCAGVHLGIQVQLGQEHGRGFPGGPAIGCRTGAREQIGLNGGQLAHQKIEDLLARALKWRLGPPDRVFFSDQRDVAIEVDPVPVAEGPKEPGFRPEDLDVGREIRGDISFGQLGLGGLPEKLVRHAHLEGDPIVHGDDERVRCGPLLRVHLGDPDITPRDHRFVARELLHLPVETQILGEPLVDPSDIPVSRRPPLAAGGEAGVDLRQESPVGGGVVVIGHIGSRAGRQLRGIGAGAGSRHQQSDD